MKPSRLQRLSVCLLSLGLALQFSAQAQIPSVAGVPPTDPSPTNVPPLVPSMKGVHPRLLFTTQEIAALKQQIPNDPYLHKAYQDAVAWCNTFQCPKAPPDIIVGGDTPAIWKSLGFFPALAYVYALDHNPAVKQKIIDVLNLMLSQPYWSPSSGPAAKETDNSMGAACNMEMVGILYDAVYNDLPNDLRQQLAQKMLLQCRRMYWLGHKEKGLAIKYWQNDPQPNHRWYRDAGLGACILDIADEPGVNAGYILQGFKEEMDFVMKWYPPDGDCHEGAGYQVFGYLPIATAVEMTDRLFGTNYLKTSGLKNAWTQQLYYWVPGRNSHISYGDDMNTGGGAFSNNDAAFFLGPHLTKDKNAQDALVNHMARSMIAGKNGTPFAFQWAMLAFYDPSVSPAAAGNPKPITLPTSKLFPDMGAATMRDTWDNNGVVFTFKCGPYGGYKLNEYRMATLDNGKPHYVNIAHDDPDANEFAMSLGNGFVFHPGVYTLDLKLTSEHNTVTVDDKGQLGEGDGFTQPTGSLDMRELSYLTGWKSDDKGRIIIQGEAGNAYRGVEAKEFKNTQPPPPVLKKFRRTAVWLPGEYVLVFDDIAANGSHKITWRGNAPAGTASGASSGGGGGLGGLPPLGMPSAGGGAGSGGMNTATTETNQKVNFQFLSDQTLNTAVVPTVLSGRFGNASVQQFQFTANAEAVKFACLLDPWHKSVQMKMTQSNGAVVLTVSGGGINDVWTYQPATDAHAPAQITGTRGGAPLISLTPSDKAPTE